MSARVFCLIRSVVSVAALFGLAACGSTAALPKYETPIARTRLQTVRTTAYTHTESDHLAYGNKSALGTTLRAPGPASGVVEEPGMPTASEVTAARAIPVASSAATESEEARRAAFLRAKSGDVPIARAASATPERTAAPRALPPLAREVVYGSAAADWSRWPVGTTFRVLTTGQYYRVDDYGFALSGRNTIDLYTPSKGAMNQWGVRTVPIEILQWGDDQESLRILRPRQSYRHIRRMVLELEGKPAAAARVN